MLPNISQNEPKPLQDKAERDSERLVLSEGLQKNDQLSGFLKRWWKHWAVVIGAIFAFLYARSVFQETYISDMRQAGDLLYRTSLEYRTYREMAEKSERSEEENQQLQMGYDNLTQYITALSDAREPYKTIASLYRILLESTAGNEDKLQEMANHVDYTSILEGSGVNRPFAEFLVLTVGRSLIDSEYEKGKEMLSFLAKSGEYADLSAAVALLRSSVSKEEKTTAREILNSLIAKKPEYVPIVSGL